MLFKHLLLLCLLFFTNDVLLAVSPTSEELFWEAVLETSSKYVPDSAIVINGKTVTENSADLQRKMFASCTLPDRFAEEFFASPPSTVLDLGAGIGANSLLMAKNGADVTALDSSLELLTTYAAKASKVYGFGTIELYHSDITMINSYGGPYKLVLAVDVLPYLPSNQLKATMEKIHKCLEDGGLFIGTIFTTDKEPLKQEIMERLGAHCYKGENFAEQLLLYSGFTPLEIEKRKEGGISFKAQKLSSEKK